MRILVVEHNPLLRQAADNFLDALSGCETVLAASAEEALRLAPLLHPDLVLLDYALCRSKDACLVRRLKGLDPPPLVVVLLPEDSAGYRNACLLAGADLCTEASRLGQALPPLLEKLTPRTTAPAARA